MTAPRLRGARVRAALAFALALSLVLTSLAIAPAGFGARTASAAATTYYIAPNGNDASPGTQSSPWRTFGSALKRLRPGDILVARGGTYVERAMLRGSDLTAGTSSARITVRSAKGENPVIKGQLWLSNASYWTFDNIDVTWDPNYVNTQEPMVRFYGGKNFIYRNSEVWGARSFAAILVTEYASGWTLRNLFVHDTVKSNGLNQDHLIYVAKASNGMIERCLLVNAPNGRGIKIGNSDPGTGLPSGIVARYNTLVNAGAGNIGFSLDAQGNNAHRNVMVNAGPAWTNLAAFNLTGGNNRVSNNVGWGSAGVVAGGTPLINDGGNRYLDPQLDANYKPRNAALYSSGVLKYGHLAGQTGP